MSFLLKKKKKVGGLAKMAQTMKALVTKPNHWSLIYQAHVWGKNQLLPISCL